MTKAANIVTYDEAVRAIFIDFEKTGRADDPPVLLGVYWLEDGSGEPRFDQWIVDPRLRRIERTKVPGAPEGTRCRAKHLDVIASEVAQRSLVEGRLVLSWSLHDLALLTKHVTDPIICGVLEERHRDAKLTAKRWLHIVHPGVKPPKPAYGGGHKLAFYLKLTGYVVPKRFGEDVAAKGINAITEALVSRGGYNSDVSLKVRQAWKATRGHNYHDCAGMFHVVERATKELAAAKSTNGTGQRA